MTQFLHFIVFIIFWLNVENVVDAFQLPNLHVIGNGFFAHFRENNSVILSPIPVTLEKRQSQAPPQEDVPSSNSSPITAATAGYTISAGNGMIEYTIECDPQVDQTTCQNVGATFKLVGDEISQVINFNAPLKFSAKFNSFCMSNDPLLTRLSASCNKIIGFGKPSAFFNIEESSRLPDVMYPQPVLKQLIGGGGTAQWQPFDCLMEFNSDIPYYFNSAANPSGIADNEYDLHYIIAHETIHALGMVTFMGPNLATADSASIAQNLNASSPINLGKLLTPPYKRDGTSFYRPNIFDFYLQSASIGRWFNAVPKLNAMLDQAASAQAKSEAILTAAAFYKEATSVRSTNLLISKDIFTTSSISSQNFGDGNTYSVILNTNQNPFAVGTSLVHVDAVTHSYGQDFLMKPTAPLGVTLQSVVDKYRPVSGPYGREVITVLAALGYELHANVKGMVQDGMQSGSLSAFGIENSWTTALFSFIFVSVMFSI